MGIHKSRKNRRRGFTIIELIIVIAIVAILAAVLIPAFAGILQKVDLSVKKQTVKSVNSALAIGETNASVPKTMHEAIKMLEQNGISEDSVSSDDTDNIIVWCSDTNRFAIVDKELNTLYSYDGQDVVKDYNLLWIAVDNIPLENKFSLYLTDDFAAEEIDISVSIDIGNNSNVKKITYNDKDDAEKSVMISAASDVVQLNINNSSDTVNVSGLFDNLVIINPAEREKALVKVEAVVKKIDIEGGKLDILEGSEIGELNVNANDSTEIFVSLQEGAKIDQLIDTNGVLNDSNYQAPDSSQETPTDPPEFDPSTIVPLPGKVAYIVSTQTQISTLEEALRVGGEIVLLADTEEKELTLSSDTVIDLNGHSISNGNSLSNVFIVEGFSLTIKDTCGGGNIINNCSVSNKAIHAIRADNQSKVIIESGIVTALHRAIYIEDSTFAMSGGKIASENRAIITAGSVDMTITGGEIYGFTYFCAGTFNITGGTFKGDLACITMRKGTLNISGGQFLTTGKGAVDFPESSTDSVVMNGAVIHADTVKIDSGVCKINITGGTLQSQNYCAICITGKTEIKKNYSSTLIVSLAQITSAQGFANVFYRGMAEANISVGNNISILKK